MQVADRCLADGGIAFIHTIGANQSLTRADDFSNKYIFPNGMLPSIAQLGKAMEKIFVMEDWHNIGPNYDKTLLAWNANFERAWPELKSKYSERFRPHVALLFIEQRSRFPIAQHAALANRHDSPGHFATRVPFS